MIQVKKNDTYFPTKNPIFFFLKTRFKKSEKLTDCKSLLKMKCFAHFDEYLKSATGIVGWLEFGEEKKQRNQVEIRIFKKKCFRFHTSDIVIHP